jgi:putative DNA primase/helicase
MKYINDTHQTELQASAIASDIIALNFRSFDGTNENDLDEVFTQLIEEPAHNNNGTLSGKSQNDLANAIRGGGWMFEGHRGICIKPDNPRIDKDGKVIKYESPRGMGKLQLFIPKVSIKAGLAISTKHGLEQEYRARIEKLEVNVIDSPASYQSREDTGFWEWFLTTELPIILTEGAKKGCSLVSNGYPAIALNGVWGWGTNDKDMFGEVERDDRGKSIKTIHPDLELFLDGRELIIAFDRDTNPDTIRYVEAAKSALIRAIDDDGIVVTDLKWRTPKGIDDYLAAKGVKSLDRLYANRKEVKVKVKTSIASRDDESIGFTTDRDRGLMLLTEVDGETRSKYIGNHLEAIAYVNNPTQDGAALLLEFKTIQGHIHRWTMPRADLAGDGASIIAELLSRDYTFNRRQKAALLDYLFSLGQHIDRTYTVTDSSGWVGKSFVLPHQTYGNENLKFRDVDPSPDALTQVRGTLQSWKDNVAARCGGNSRLILGLGVSFAAPLLPLVGIESGGFHLLGGTSQGKTIILDVAASVTGLKTVPRWLTTSNGLESTATAFNHLCLPLDEIGQADPHEVGNIAYMLANGQGKARMKRDLTNRKSKTWQLIVLSSGEVGMGRYMQQAGVTQKGGQEVRLPDIPAVPDGSSYGCFETIHGAKDGGEFAAAMEAAVKEHHGTALDAFLTRLVVDTEDPAFVGNLAKQTHLIANKLAEGMVDTAIARVAKRFALVQVALGLAHKYGLLPFPVEQIAMSIAAIFKAWLTARGGDGSIEIKQAIDNIKHLLTTNEFSDRVFTLPNNNDRPVRNLLAYRTVDIDGHTTEFLVPPSVFDREFCNGVNKTELVRELQRLGLMILPRLDGKSTSKRRVNGKQQNFYVFGKRENEGVTGVTGVTAPQNSFSASDSEIDKCYPQSDRLGVTGVTPPLDPSSLLPPLPPEKIAGVTGIDSQTDCPDGLPAPVTPVTPVTPEKTRLGKISKFYVGDRVRYVGPTIRYKGWAGVVAQVVYGTHVKVTWDKGKTTESIPFAELEAISYPES